MNGMAPAPPVPRLSEIAGRELPHDLLVLTSRDEAGRVRIEASSRDDWPRGTQFVGHGGSPVPGDFFVVIEDRRAHMHPLNDRSGFTNRIRTTGYRSILEVGLTVRQQRMVLTFCSRRSAAFTVDDLAAARRIGGLVARALSRQRTGGTVPHVDDGAAGPAPSIRVPA